MNRMLYARRRFTNRLLLGLSVTAAAFGLLWLAAILGVLIAKGLDAFTLKLFYEVTPAPTYEGGLANAIFGSLLMNTIAVAVGTPIGILAGTYLAEYGRHTRIAAVVRFINDILLSAPSILLGLFVYLVMVDNTNETFVKRACDAVLGGHCPLGHFSAWAGAAALAVLVIPVVVRTTENMLLLVPNTLREAAASIGAPRSISIRMVTWRAARAGIITGVLLAIARISGETAPLLFTAFGNLNWSSDINGPMASLPLVIYNFANSAYDGLHQLAWAGALLITIAVLGLSIFARMLEGKRSTT